MAEVTYFNPVHDANALPAKEIETAAAVNPPEIEQEQSSVDPVALAHASYTAGRRLIYGAKGKLTAESLEDEKNPMVDGCDHNGGDGQQTDGMNEDEDDDNGLEGPSVDQLRLQKMKENNMINPTGAFRKTWDIVQAFLLVRYIHERCSTLPRFQ